MQKLTICLRLLLIAASANLLKAQNSTPGKSAILLDGVAAYINSETITLGEVMSEVRQVPLNESSAELYEKRLRELYAATLNAMIDRKLILLAAHKGKLVLQPWLVDNRIREIVNNHFEGDQSKLHDYLAERKIAFEEWKKTIEEDLKITAMRHQQVEGKINPSPAEVRQEYEENKGRYQTDSAVAVSMIILDPPERAEDESIAARATRIAEALKAGTSFAELAKTYSKDNKAANGGSWGKVNPLDVFRREICDALDKLLPGEHSQMLELEGYGYIVRKDEQQDIRTLTFEEAAPYAERQLRMRQSEEIYKKWLQRLRADAYIRTFELPL